MAIILNIDSAIETASLCLSQNGVILSFKKNDSIKDHSVWMHSTIQLMLQESGFSIQQLNAISVTIGPGSYTGLRIGLATAKGLCFALKIPLITINTLEAMADSAIRHFVQTNKSLKTPALFCPMIDARRMEVFTALYDIENALIEAPKALILNSTSFEIELEKNSIYFFGNGSNKWREHCTHANACFESAPFDASKLMSIAEKYFAANKYTDLAYSEPLYLKEFYSHSTQTTHP